GANVARLQDLLEESGANEKLKHAGGIHGRRIGFHAFRHPPAPLTIGDVHEFRADGAAIALARLGSGFAFKGKFGWRERLNVTQRVEVRREVSPAAKFIK